MRYVCSHCGAVWESETEPARCPTCFRRHGILPADEERARPGAKIRLLQGKKGLLVAAAAALLLMGGAGIVWWLLAGGRHRSGARPRRVLGPQPQAALRAALSEAGVERAEIPFRATPAVQRWALSLRSQSDRPRALWKSLHSLLKPDGAWEAVSEPDPRTVLTARGLVEGSGGRAHGFALASLGVAAARSLGWKAAMVEIHSTRAVVGPADPSGRLGRYGVALFARSYGDATPLAVVDPLAREGTPPSEYTLLDDLAALGAYLNLRAQALLASDPATARILAVAAGRLAPDSATVHCGRGTVLSAIGDLTQGMAALQLAATKRDDGPRHLCLAVGYLGQRDVARALAELRLAAKKAEKYAEAYALQAKVLLAVGQVAKAQELADRAAEIQPGLGSVRFVRALLAATQGRTAEAEAALKGLLGERPADFEVFMALWQLYRGTGKSEEARALAEKFAARLPESARTRFREQLSKLGEAMERASGGAKESGGGAPGPGGPPPGGPAGLPPAPPPDFKLQAPTRVGPRSGPADVRLKF